MTDVFLKILNMSITASWLLLAVFLVRLLLKKAPKWVSGVFWAMAALRLIIPFSLPSDFSLIPSTETIPPDIALMQKPAITSGLELVNQAPLHRIPPRAPTRCRSSFRSLPSSGLPESPSCCCMRLSVFFG